MSARLLFEVALRVLGLWFVCNSVTSFTTAASLYLTIAWSSVTPSVPHYVVASASVTTAVQLVLGTVLIRWAPGMAARCYPPGAANEASQSRVGPGDVYHTACFVLGVYLLVLATEPVSRLVIAGIGRTPGWSHIRLASDAVTIVMYTVTGILLVFGSRPLSELLSNLRYNPDTIPKQQISIAVLLIIVLLFAVVLTVIRRMSLGGLW